MFFQRGVPADAEIKPVDRRGREKARPGPRTFVHAVFPPWRLPLSQITNGKRHPLRHSADRQRAGDDPVIFAEKLDFIAFESNLRVMLGVEKVRASKMSVSIEITGPDAGCVDRGFQRSVARVCSIEDERAEYS